MSSLLCLIARAAPRCAVPPSGATARAAKRALGGLATAGGAAPTPTGPAAAAAAVRSAPGGGHSGGVAASGRGPPTAVSPHTVFTRGAKPGKTHHAASRRFAVDAETGQILRRKQGMSHKRYVKSASRKRGLSALTVIHPADRRRVGVLLATARKFRL
ncbi:hypothetical protein MMPV_003373 [Pyropia vietnamensis]